MEAFLLANTSKYESYRRKANIAFSPSDLTTGFYFENMPTLIMRHDVNPDVHSLCYNFQEVISLGGNVC